MGGGGKKPQGGGAVRIHIDDSHGCIPETNTTL